MTFNDCIDEAASLVKVYFLMSVYCQQKEDNINGMVPIFLQELKEAKEDLAHKGMKL